MKARFSVRAIRTMTSIWDYIAEENPESASRLLRRIVDSTFRLEHFPYSVRTGELQNTRELIVVGSSYKVAYRIVDDVILILAVIHTSRRWPKKL
jgi:plasmid stabilization system protein ParE